MLLRISVSNHLSLRDPQELSFVTSSLKDPTDGLIECPASPTGFVLPALVIYGANASGKSNVVDAVETMRAMVLYSHARGYPGGGVLHQPFRLDEESSKRPSRFEVDFVTDGVRHHYGFEASDREFLSEWLYAFPKSRRRTLFQRDGNEFSFGRGLKGPNATIRRLTRPNSLFLSAAAQNDHERLTRVFAYFRSMTSDRDIAVQGPEASLRLGDQGLDSRVIEFLKRVDPGVAGYRHKKIDISEEQRVFTREFLAVINKVMKSDIDTEMIETAIQTQIELSHHSQTGKRVYFELKHESAGTRRLLVLLGPAFCALDASGSLFIDELDASLHTLACEAVLRLFCSQETNSKGAQLIATTHNAHLMRSSVLRRDQIWFTQKRRNGSTELYPLTDIRTRKGDNFESGYLQGRYGAVPFEAPYLALGSTK